MKCKPDSGNGLPQSAIYLVSACLLGVPSAYDGKARLQAELIALAAQGQVVPVCPEVAGGLGVPRPPAEIVGGDGDNVLDGHARVMTVAGEDVTEAYLRGAECALVVVRRYGITTAILKQHSPSCGSTCVYDGTHSGRLRAGQGVTAALLRRHGVTIWSEENASICLQKDLRGPRKYCRVIPFRG